MTKLTTVATALALFSLVPACLDDATTDDPGEDLDGDGKADSSNSVSADNLNGISDTKVGSSNAADTIIESWSAIGIRIHYKDGRMRVLTGAMADRAIRAAVALFDALEQDSAEFEAYILAHGVTKSTTAAPTATGF